jgi:hypothetical protein
MMCLMCRKADQLRQSWYATAERFGSDFDPAVVAASRDQDYTRALDRYKAHRLTCPACAAEIGREIPAKFERAKGG